MLFSQYNDNRLMFVHRSDRHPANNEFPEIYLSACEIILPVSGDVSFMVEGEVYTPKFGDIMIFTPYELHKTIINSDSLYDRIVIQIRSDSFSDDAAANKIFAFLKNMNFGEVNLIKKTESQGTKISDYIKALADIRSDNLNEIIPFLLPLLSEIKLLIEKRASPKEPEKIEISAEIIKYINENLSSELVPDEIADRFHISRSKLDKLFRKSFDTSVWSYIIRKRLHFAQELIKSGERPTSVAAKCGFKDYTTFYKAYKAKFGLSPKEDKE